MVGEHPGRVGPFLARRIADSAELRTRVEAAYNLGISVRRFDGWEPAEVHEHEHDQAGRIVRTVVRREPEWDEEQRGWVLAWLLYRANVHKPCGHYLPDATDPDAEGAYMSEPPIRCHVCTERAAAYKRVQEAGNRHPEALLFPVRKKE